jgi:hypothetical protein
MIINPSPGSQNISVDHKADCAFVNDSQNIDLVEHVLSTVLMIVTQMHRIILKVVCTYVCMCSVLIKR